MKTGYLEVLFKVTLMVPRFVPLAVGVATKEAKMTIVYRHDHAKFAQNN